MRERDNRIEVLGDPGGDLVEIAEHQTGWEQAFTEWSDRIARAVGAAGLRIDHIGSTAVPGLPAKPVIDIQVSVEDADDEDRYVPGLSSLGLVLRIREPGHRFLRPPAGRPRTVHVHICDAGGAWEREHLLFRDYLRAHPEYRDAYARLKRDLASRHLDDRLAYTEGKAAFIADTLAMAEAWARQTGWSVD